MDQEFTLIAEVKTSSPFGWQSPRSWEQLFALAATHGDMLSIHTDSRWGGSFDLVRRARQQTSKPILAKGIHASDRDIIQALEAGADWVLVVGRTPAVHLDKCLLEPDDLAQLCALPPATKAVWNSRDLATGGFKTESFQQARTAWPGWLCQASNIHSIHDVHADADAALVGSELPAFVRTLAT
jgi:indole-3-glycerol phosphate synthase